MAWFVLHAVAYVSLKNKSVSETKTDNKEKCACWRKVWRQPEFSDEK